MKTWTTAVFLLLLCVNDTLACAVGEVYVRDSSGVGRPVPYNMARLNGSTWRIRRVPRPPARAAQQCGIPHDTLVDFASRDT
jgi:hypothetical protein